MKTFCKIFGISAVVFSLTIFSAKTEPAYPDYYPYQYQSAPQAQPASSPRAIQASSRGSRAGVQPNVQSKAGTMAPSRGGVSNATNPRGGANATQRARSAMTATPGASGGGAATPSRAAQSRGIASRSAANQRSASSATNTPGSRTVRSRSGAAVPAVEMSRVSLQGSAIRASTGRPVGANNNPALYNKLQQQSFANIIDPTTGLISADAYSNCLDSYYACMDEICTARNPGQRRCACAARVVTFNAAEITLQKSREDLLRVMGELALIISSKGEDISHAFRLTDAEKALNCVSWRDAVMGNTKEEWCKANTLLAQTTNCANYRGDPPFVSEYCKNNDFGWGSDWMKTLNGADSSIMSLLSEYVKNTDRLNTITRDNGNDFLKNTLGSMSAMVTSASGISTAWDLGGGETIDQLAKTWGYELFAYAHNNVCNRVLDSCFNGIYEACDNASKGPYNYNSEITVTNKGQDINFKVSSATSSSAANMNNASCFGYRTNQNVSYTGVTSAADPYAALRKPVADARRSVLQKYVLDANADCDLYGEELRRQTETMALQKIAATQTLQQQRLAFKQEKDAKIEADALAAKNNFGECMSELLECYTTNATQSGWSTSRIKTYCAQVANVPSCYQTMMCNPSSSPLMAVIDLPDASNCNNDPYGQTDPNTGRLLNTCRNVVTLSEILKDGSGLGSSPNPTAGNSAQLREKCLRDSFVGEIRGWDKLSPTDDIQAAPPSPSCSGIDLNSGADANCMSVGQPIGLNICVSIGCRCIYKGPLDEEKKCPTANCPAGSTDWQLCSHTGQTVDVGGVTRSCISNGCVCYSGKHAENGECTDDTRQCSPMPANTTAGTQTWNTNTQTWNTACKATACSSGYSVQDNQCKPD